MGSGESKTHLRQRFHLHGRNREDRYNNNGVEDVYASASTVLPHSPVPPPHLQPNTSCNNLVISSTGSSPSYQSSPKSHITNAAAIAASRTANTNSEYGNASTTNGILSSLRLRNSRRKSKAYKGLANPVGSENCFLNVVIQALFQTPEFRYQVRVRDMHFHRDDSCVWCALKVLFAQYENSEERVIPPDALRDALSKLYAGESRFRQNAMNDASEAFEAVLEALHLTMSDSHDAPSVIHRIFGYLVSEQSVCGNCGSRSEPLVYWTWSWYVPCNEILMFHERNKRMSFEEVLLSVSEDEVQICHNDTCKARAQMQKTLLQAPHVVVLGIVWDDTSCSRKKIKNFVNFMPMQLSMKKAFRALDNEPDENTTAYLSGFFGYYGQHYVFFWYDATARMWLLFNDTKVTKLGPLFDDDVADYIVGGHVQPCLIFYTTASAVVGFHNRTPSMGILEGTSFQQGDNRTPTTSRSTSTSTSVVENVSYPTTDTQHPSNDIIMN